METKEMKFRYMLTMLFLITPAAAEHASNTYALARTDTTSLDSRHRLCLPDTEPDTPTYSAIKLTHLESEEIETATRAETDYLRPSSDEVANQAVMGFDTAEERERNIQFSLGYFIATQQLLIHKAGFHAPLQIENISAYGPHAAIAVANTTSSARDNITRSFPRAEYEMADTLVTAEIYATGIHNGEMRLLKAINGILAATHHINETNRFIGFRPGRPPISAYR
ncbi:hypothetical protein ACUHMQ_01650 [Chitinimonas sp. PSY-7]|uniref:hypothetical protein n=1 Tax=Chitinimonas sp. PSY-7 TaxID=3459088 RepID=UPI00403FF768